MQALLDTWDPLEERVDVLETTLDDVIKASSPENLRRLSDDLLRRILARLPRPLQDALHGRLYPDGRGFI